MTLPLPLTQGDGRLSSSTGAISRWCCSTSELSPALGVGGDDNLDAACGGDVDRRRTADCSDGWGILDGGLDVKSGFTELSAAVRVRFTGAASELRRGVSGVIARRLLTTVGNLLPALDANSSPSTSPVLSTRCVVRALLRRGIKPRPAVLPVVDVVSARVALTLSSFVDVGPFCRLIDASPPASCLETVRLTEPGVAGDGMDDNNGLADFALELAPLAEAAAAAVLLALRLSGCALELAMRRAKPDRRAPATTPPPVVELLAMLLILVDDSARLGTDDDDDRLPPS